MKWLRDKFRQWLLPEEDEQITELDVMAGGCCLRGYIVKAVGLKLLVRVSGGEFLIGPKQCADPKRFWKAWGQRVDESRMTWEDGSQFKQGD